MLENQENQLSVIDNTNEMATAEDLELAVKKEGRKLGEAKQAYFNKKKECDQHERSRYHRTQEENALRHPALR